MRIPLRTGLALWALLMVVPSATDARTWKVGTTEGSCDGTCDFDNSNLGNNGFGIRAAMLSPAVVPGDTVLVWPGNYPARVPMKSGVVLRSKDGVAVTRINGFAGLESAITFTACNASTVLEGFTISWDATANGIGGAVRAFVSDGTIRDCVIRDCLAGIGAGVYLQTSDMTIENNLFLGNDCVAGGGVIAISGGSPVVRGNTLIDCTAPFGSDGAAVFAVGASHTLERNVIAGSTGATAIYCDGTNEPDIRCNLVFDNEIGHYGGSCVDSTGTSGNISGDPQFCDPAYGSFPDIGDFNVCVQSMARTTACGTIGWVDPDGEFPCGDCGPTGLGASVEVSTWGRTRSLYR